MRRSRAAVGAPRGSDLHTKRADLVDDAREGWVRGAQMGDGNIRIKAEPAILLDQRRRAVQLHTFYREHTALGGDAALSRKAADFAAGGEYAMARHDDREWVTAERLPDGACRARCADPCGDVAIRQGHACWNGACRLVDTAMKSRHLVHVKGNGREIARLTAQQRNETIDDALHFGRRGRFSRSGKPLKHARPRFPLTRLGELNAGDATLTPRDPAPADRCVEECKAARHHDAILTSRKPSDLENLAAATLSYLLPQGCAVYVDTRCRFRCFSKSRIAA